MNFFYNILDSILLEFADFSAFNFQHPKILWLALVPILFLVFEIFPARTTLQNTNKLKKFVDEHLIPHITKPFSNKKNYGRNLYFSLFFILCVIALANPRWDYTQEEVFKPNVNIVLLLDVSKSMNAEDEKPNRLERAKQEIEDIIKSTEGVSIGLIAFADTSNIIAPVTDDKNALKYFISAIDKNLFDERASRIDKGMASAERMLKQYKDGDNFIIIFSDGGFETYKPYPNILNENANTNIIGIGFGSDAGAGIPGDSGEWIKDENGKMVVSKLDEVEFKKLVSNSNYVKASYLDDDTKKVVNLIKAKTNHANTKQKTDRIWHDRFYIPLILAMLMFLFKFKRSASFPVILIMLCCPMTSYAADKKPATSGITWENIKHEISQRFSKYFKNADQQAVENYNAKNYGEASSSFKNSYNKGLAEFKAGNLRQSVEDFKNYSASLPNDKSANNLKADALYNQGNAEMFMPDVEGAIKTYEEALKLNPAHTQAQHNLEIAKKIMEEKKKQDEQQKQQQEKNNKNNKKNKDKNKDKNSDKQNENQSNSAEKNSDENKDTSDNKNNDNKNNEAGDQQKNPSSSDKDNKKPESDKSADDGKKDENKNPDNKAGDYKNDQQKPNENKDAASNNEENKTNGEQNKNKNSPASMQQRKTSLDTSAEEMMNRLKNDPSSLLKRRFQMNKNKENDNMTGGNKPW